MRESERGREREGDTVIERVREGGREREREGEREGGITNRQTGGHFWRV